MLLAQGLEEESIISLQHANGEKARHHKFPMDKTGNGRKQPAASLQFVSICFGEAIKANVRTAAKKVSLSRVKSAPARGLTSAASFVGILST